MVGRLRDFRVECIAAGGIERFDPPVCRSPQIAVTPPSRIENGSSPAGSDGEGPQILRLDLLVFPRLQSAPFPVDQRAETRVCLPVGRCRVFEQIRAQKQRFDPVGLCQLPHGYSSPATSLRLGHRVLSPSCAYRCARRSRLPAAPLLSLSQLVRFSGSNAFDAPIITETGEEESRLAASRPKGAWRAKSRVYPVL